MLSKIFTKIFGTKFERDTKKLRPIVDEINEYYSQLQSLSDNQLKAKTLEFKERLKDGETDSEILPEAFAVVKDAARRLVGTKYKILGQDTVWDMVHYNVQLIGGIALHNGNIAEMATGEGKTLVATLPVYLNALSGKGVHIVTVNDYLARRDACWMGLLYLYLGITVSVIQDRSSDDNSFRVVEDPDLGVKMITCSRKEAYQADVLFGTNAQFGFDYLYDNMAVDISQLVQRGFYYAIIDEVDSVLIDEARTPLIISGSVDHSNQKYDELKPRVEQLWNEQVRLVNRIVKQGSDLLKEPEKEYEAGVQLLRASRGAPKHKQLMKLFKEQGVKRLVQTVENDYIRDKKMFEIDDELYFAIDEKQNSVDISDLGLDFLAGKQDRKLFVLPDLSIEVKKIDDDHSYSEDDKLRMKEKLHRDYALQSEKLHNMHQLLKGYALFEKDVDYVVQDNKVMIVDQFTGRLMPGRRYSDGLHQALEAKENVAIEKETQTLATITIQNFFRMYGKLAGMTGTAVTEENEFYQIYKLPVMQIPTNEPVRRSDYDDVIYRTKREKYNAVIDEIDKMYQDGRPVLVGTVSVEVSETLGRMLQRRKIPHNILNAKYHQQEAEIVAKAGQKGAITIATNMAGRGTDIKLGSGVVKYQNEAKIKDNVDPNSGLHIIGTERHESRRIDRQLRGRAGRQGDPGTSRFYLSLEDDLMRLFGSERIASMLDKINLEEGEVITHPWISKTIETAQKKVEERNFGIRKRLLEYDDVMNSQREVIYDLRQHVLQGDNMRDYIMEIMDEVIEDMVERYSDPKTYQEEWDWTGLYDEFAKTFLIPITDTVLDEETRLTIRIEGLIDILSEYVKNIYQQRENFLGEELMRQIERYRLLQVMDEKWRDHLYEMDQLKEGINLRAYGQRDPLIEYKTEGFNLFTELLMDIKRTTLSLIPQTQQAFIQKALAEQQNRKAHNVQARHDVTRGYAITEQNPAVAQTVTNSGEATERKQKPITRNAPKVGRNDPCPCGSGKKYKKCCGLKELQDAE